MPTGYTIAEVMIVLAVTGALFVSAMGLISGQQGRTQFTQDVRKVETDIRDVMNDVSTGYYPNVTSLKCTVGGSAPTIVSNPSPGTDILGTNEACIYVGQALQFRSNLYVRHSIVGLRRDPATGLESANIVNAKIRSATPQNGSDTTPDATQTFNIPAGMRVGWVRYNGAQDIGTIAFIGEFAGLNATNLLQSKAGKQVDLVPVKASLLTDNKRQAAKSISDLTTVQVLASKEIIDKNPSTGISLCLTNESQQAIIVIGGDDLSVGTRLTISGGNCP